MIAAARAIPAGDRSMQTGGFQHGVPVGVGLAGFGVVGLGRLGASRSLCARPRNEGHRLEPEPDRYEGRGGGRRSRSQIGSDERHRRHIPAHGSVASEPWSHRRRRHCPHEARRHSDQHDPGGPLVDEASLIAAVEAGKIIAALDVYDEEPLPPGIPRFGPQTIRCSRPTWLRSGGDWAPVLSAER